MDLRDFTQSKKTENKKELILDNEDIKITKIGENIEFFLKRKESLEKYKNFLFFSTTNSKVSNSIDDAKDYFKQSIDDGVEGLMVKSLKSQYKPGLRVGNWAKIKEVNEDLDLVIIGAEHGKGKRAGYYSSFIVAVQDTLSEEFLEIGKVSSGIKELGDEGASLEKITSLLKPLKIKEEKGVTFFEAKIIIQVRYQEIQSSTSYNSGYALRFPRIIALREDKNLEEINTLEDIKKFSKV